MKRFYSDVTIGPDDTILLDGRPVKTPARGPLCLPSERSAEAVAGEWRAQGETIDPRTMPLTGLANAAIDRVAPDPAAFAAPLARYAETDLLCYRADSPAELVAAEAEAWDPLLAWAQTRYDIRFEIAAGIVHKVQPAATIARLAEALWALDVFTLAAMNPLITIGGSLVAALAIAAGTFDADPVFEALHLDELWQARHWGEDPLAIEAREARRKDFLGAARLIALL